MFFLILLVPFSASLVSCGPDHRPERPYQDQLFRLDLSRLLQSNPEEDFPKADRVIPLHFPQDHGPHRQFKSEWWYFTGNLSTKSGRKFGYQFTIFRNSLSANPAGRYPQKDQEQSHNLWKSNQAYMAHVTLTDISGEKFLFEERFSRELPGLAYAQSKPFAVYLENLKIKSLAKKNSSTQTDIFPLQIGAQSKDFSLDLILNNQKKRILQGDRGLSKKGKLPGNASYYYSYTRLPSRGKVKIGKEIFSVAGSSWFDREWGSSLLEKDLSGWDWFSLQLSDNTEIMFYRLRKKDGRVSPYSHFVLIDTVGNKREIELNRIRFKELGYWSNPQNRRYPSSWQLEGKDKGFILNITAALKNQELKVSIPYWEGSVLVQGIKNGKKITGRGYVELTGY